MSNGQYEAQPLPTLERYPDSRFIEETPFVTRFARVVAVGVPHHVTQRGNGRQFVLSSATDCKVYTDLLRQSLEFHELSLLGYCLMSNHVHLILVPEKPEALGRALKDTHGRYASYWNATRHSNGHVWQGRFYSCPLDDRHLWEALRYTELNPVRAGMTVHAEQWEYSSAAAHCGVRSDSLLTMHPWKERWSASEWRIFLSGDVSESSLVAIRQNTHTGRPLGGAPFIKRLELETNRVLAAQQRGRPRKVREDLRQESLKI